MKGLLPTIRRLYGTDGTVDRFIRLPDEQRGEFFLYLDDPLVVKTSNMAERHFSMNSELFKRKFKTKEEFPNTSCWYREHYRMSSKI